ncbi:hypothetical protein LCGC14_1076350 [marine sediment metagenome]|uniref:Uncharacterized protein n=2 Tax=root TaxID=1 RepID=A0A831VRQ5_9FLAO|nr:hypothetical protein [Pricia antarctica]
MKKSIVLILLICIHCCHTQEQEQVELQARLAIDEIREFVAIPSDVLNYDDINKNLVWLNQKFDYRGFRTSILPTDGEPLFMAILEIE